MHAVSNKHAARTVLTVLAAAVLASLTAGSTAARRRAAARPLTPSLLSHDLLVGARMRRVPRGIHPPLSAAAGAKPIIVRNGCHVSHLGLRSKPCTYGDVNSHTAVALFGDSHAAAWFPAVNLISRQQHWRLVIFTKDGCPPVEVDIIAMHWNDARYWQCSRWRARAMKQIAALRPALVIVTWARWWEVPEATATPGVPTGHGSPWLNGVAATFQFLAQSAKRVIFISDVPALVRKAPGCIRTHASDLRACDSPRRTAVRLPRVKSDELALAAAENVKAIDPTPWFCSPHTCPVIARKIILYRDNSHMSPAWSRFIASVLARSISLLMGSRSN
jgi:hypothetical protein